MGQWPALQHRVLSEDVEEYGEIGKVQRERKETSEEKEELFEMRLWHSSGDVP